ncbi:hypothetical protein TNCV_869141 [Trichonephila clavipes]|nr:hypothetical protein TNCV_869141 [Trichonephila clavipes]
MACRKYDYPSQKRNIASFVHMMTGTLMGKNSQHQEKLVLGKQILKDMAGMYQLRRNFWSSGQGIILPQEDRVPGDHIRRGRMTAVFGIWLWCLVLRLRQKFEPQ